ncbi:MAG: chemotaxis protein CheR [Desulfovibrio sp.]|nr:chemotaxis protein CheR [Desulfovibrio sp.]
MALPPPTSKPSPFKKPEQEPEKPTSLYKPRQPSAFGQTSAFAQAGATTPRPASPFAKPAAQPAAFGQKPAETRPFTSLRSQAQAGNQGSTAFSRFSRPATTQAASPTAPKPASPLGTARDTQPAAPRSTSPFRKELHITDEEFLLIRDFIYQQCGIFIAENRKYLVENRLSNRIKELNLKSYNEYYNYLRFDNNKRQELTKLFEVVTTNETSFFRNPPQLEVFQRVVLADAIADARKSGVKKLRIWSAGCSTGEEPYTLAIILHETLRGEIDNWDIKITANDLSEAVLAAARRGIYNEYALRTTPKEMVAKYFTKEGNVYKINQALKRLVSFGQINLSDKEMLKRVEKSQIVFCRNVIIYFDDEMKRKVINAFYDNLLPKGVLIIGHSESLHNISRAFQLEHHKGTILYRKTS